MESRLPRAQGLHLRLPDRSRRFRQAGLALGRARRDAVAPLLTHAVKLDLPKASSQPNQLKPDEIEFAIDPSGQRLRNGEPVSRDEAARRFAAEGKKSQQPELHLRADHSVAYRALAETLADASKAGLSTVGFVSQPEAQ